MYFNLRESTGLVNPNINVIFDDSIYAVDDDKEFVFEGGRLFNSSVTFPSYAEAIRVVGDVYNYPINFPNNVKNISGLINACPNFNQPINVPSTVTRCNNALSGIRFNSPVNIEYGVTNIDELFRAPQYQGYSNFNQPIDVPDSVVSMISTFQNCGNFNSPVNIGNQVVNMNYAFYYCILFNQPVNIPDSVTDCAYSFVYCSQFDSPVNFGNSVRNVYAMFQSAKFNKAVTLPNSLKDANGMFYGAAYFNAPVTMNGQENLRSMFYSATNFNQPITVPNECVNMSSTFTSAYNFNSVVTFGSTGNLTEMNGTFSSAIMFNQNVNIPDGVVNCVQTFSSITEYNATVIIPNTVKNTYQMFYGINACPYNFQNSRYAPCDYNALRQPIYMYCDNLMNSWYMFQSCVSLTNLYLYGIQNNSQLIRFMRSTGTNRCNIYTDDVGQKHIYNTPQLLDGGQKPTWTNDATNGCIYNTTYNLYVYNNWDGVIN